MKEGKPVINSISSFKYLLALLLTILISSELLALPVYDGGYDETGFQPSKVYLNYSPQEFIDPYSGNLTLSHTDITLPGNGGLDLSIQRTYNSKQYFVSPPTSHWIVPEGAMGIGWDLHFGRIAEWDEPYLPVAALTMPDGSIYQIYNNNHQNISSHVNAGYVAENFAVLNFDGSVWTMTLTDGTVYTFGRRVEGAFGFTGEYLVTSVKDKNGNEINIEYYDCCNFQVNNGNSYGGTLGTCPGDASRRKAPHIKQITDSVGRVVKFNWLNNSCSSSSQSNVISSMDVNGKIYNNYIYQPIPVDSGGQAERTIYALSEVKHPEGPGWIYGYEFDGVLPDGEIKTVVYPSGGTVEYSFTTLTHDPQKHISPFDSTIPLKTRAVASRTASGPDITPGTWTYSYGILDNQISTTVTDPCDNRTVYKFHGALKGSHIGDWAITLLDEKEVLDSNGNLVQSEKHIWDPYQISVNFNRTEQGFFFPLLSSKTVTRDSNNYVTNFTYNTFYGAPTKIEEIGELARTTDITYYKNLSDGNYIVDKPLITSVTVGAETKTITNSYDSKGNLISEDKYGVTTEFFYHSEGNLAWEKNARGFYTHFDQYNFGVAGRIRYGSSSDSATDPIYTEARTINWEGTIANSTDGRGNQTLFSYDDLNRLIAITPPPSGEAPTLITYDNIAGQNFKIAKGISEVKHNFDGLGRPIGTESNVGIKSEVIYDKCGRKVYESLPFIFNDSTSNAGNSFTYDALGRVASITHPDDTFINYFYSGNTVTITNERKLNTTLNFESFGDPEDKRLISVLDVQKSTTSYKYDLLGNIIRIDSPMGGDRVFTYNSKNFLVSETHPESGTATYTHDEIGNVISKTNADNKIINYRYDRLNRLTLIDHPSVEDDVIYAYDNANNRTLMESSSGNYSYFYEYDKSNRLIRQDVNAGYISYSVDFVYDERNNLIRSIYPSGEIINYSYDTANRLSDIYDAANNLFAGFFSYHQSGAPTSYTTGFGVASDFTYDDRHRLKTLRISRTFPFLMIDKDGLGRGTVTSDRGEINCGNDCTQIYPAENIPVTLAATPDKDSNFVGWSGDSDCADGQLVMNGVKTCIATFALKPVQHTLTVDKNGTGSGTVSSNPTGIDCGDDCMEDYDFNTQITLTATPDSGSKFAGWSGDADCSDGIVTMDANKNCTATFTPQQFKLTVSKSGSGTGTVTSSPVGINCGSDCTENFDEGTQVTLTAVADTRSRFAGWNGDSDCSDGAITMNASKTCGAVFIGRGTITIEKTGSGGGTVNSVYGLSGDPIYCGSTCTSEYDVGDTIGFKVTPNSGSQFVEWETCTVLNQYSGFSVPSGDTTCIARFDLLPGAVLVVEKQGNGSGSVVSTPDGINCGNDCGNRYDESIQVTLTPIPNAGSIFGGWSGDEDCSDGVVTMNASRTCIATFTQSSQKFTLGINVSGFGLVNAGWFSSNGIDCIGAPVPVQSNDCSEDYAVNRQITLVPKTTREFTTNPPIDYNSTFLRWSGDPDCLDGEVTMDADKTCTATFTPFKLGVSTTGSGTVTINPQGNTCTTFPICSKYYHMNTQVTLTPVPNAGYIFAGWSGGPDCSDGAVTMNTNKTCEAIFTDSTQKHILTVSKSGTGAGTVVSSPSGISCGSDCTQSYAINTVVTLGATPSPGSIFDGWSGNQDCSDGVVRMDASKTCTATFTQSSQRFTITVTKTGTGTGTITSSPTGVNCGADCSEEYAVNTEVLLTVTPDAGSRLAKWTGDPGCGSRVTLDASKTCVANFEPDVFTLTINKGGVGSGNVISNVAGIDCGSDCAEDYLRNTQVILTVVPDAGFTFAGWTGDDEDCTDGIVAMDFSKNCTARFGLPSAYFAYITDSLNNSVSVIDTSANIIIDTITVGDTPIGMAISPDETLIYVANQFDDSVSVINTATNNVIATIGVGFGPGYLAISPDGTHVYVVNEFDNSVSVIDTSTNTVVNTISVGDTPKEVVINPDGTRAYVTNHVDGSVSVIDILSNTVLNTVSVGIQPKSIAISPDGSRVYVADSRNDTQFGGGNSVSVVDTSTNSVIKTINVGRGPWSLAVNPDGTRVYVVYLGDNIISVIDASSNSVINTISTEFPKSDITLSPDGKQLYLIDYLDGTLSVADITTKSEIDSIVVGNELREIVVSRLERATPQRFTLTVTKSGTGTGTATSTPAGIDCGSNCSRDFAENSQITLTAVPGSGSTFAGWSGDADCSDGVVILEADKVCTATFNVQASSCNCNDPKAIRGTDVNNILEGTANADIICGFGGNDTLKGLGGNDCIDGGSGKDKLIGGGGKDKLYGGIGNDNLQGSGGDDFLDGGSGVDTLNGGSNIDTCINGETVTYCENSSSSKNSISPANSTYSLRFKNTIKGKVQNLFAKLIKKNPTASGELKQSNVNQNPKNISRYPQLKSYIEFLRLFAVSLLFATNAYAQTTIPPTPFVDLEYPYDGVGNVTAILDNRFLHTTHN